MTGTKNAGVGTLPKPPLVYRLPAAGLMLGGLSRRTINNLIKAGELEAVPVCGIRMVTHESIVAYLARQKKRPEELEKATRRTAAARERLAERAQAAA